MRKAMICVSVMLAMFQLWPVIFGHGKAHNPMTTAAAQAAPRPIVAVAIAEKAPQIVPASASVLAPKSCYRQYQVKFQQCSAGDQACHAKTADQWDLCEATGLWPQ